MVEPPNQVVSQSKGQVAPEPFHYERWFLTAYYFLAVVWGLRSIHYWERSLLDLLVPLTFVVLVTGWAVMDARRRGHPIPLLSCNWFVLFAPYLIPMYLLWSRGWRGALWVAYHLVLWLLLATLIMNVGGSIEFGNRWWSGN